jgi:threonine/homoserine/homoserine lactone efflux protein
VVRAAGAAYLVWLGTTMLWRTWTRRGTTRRDPASRDTGSDQLVTFRPQESVVRTWLRGATANLLSAVHLARGFLDSNRVHKLMDRVTGTVLIGFGLKLALSGR